MIDLKIVESDHRTVTPRVDAAKQRSPNYRRHSTTSFPRNPDATPNARVANCPTEISFLTSQRERSTRALALLLFALSGPPPNACDLHHHDRDDPVPQPFSEHLIPTFVPHSAIEALDDSVLQYDLLLAIMSLFGLRHHFSGEDSVDTSVGRDRCPSAGGP